MQESFKEKLLNSTGRFMRKHRMMRGPVTLILAILLMGYYIFYMVSHNLKRLTSVAVLLVLYVISCSFCSPLFVFAQEAALMDTPEHLNNEEISLAGEDTLMEEELPELYDVSGNSLPGNDFESSILGEDGDSESSGAIFSVDEILAENENLDTTALEVSFEEEYPLGMDNWQLLLVNKQHPIPKDYSFELGTITGSLQCDERIIPDLLNMLSEARKDHVDLVICSPYRNQARQEMLFDRKINAFMKKGYSYMEAYKYASQAVTIPGASEHQLGLAIDIYTSDYKKLDEGFGDTPAGIWLREHCAEYGFILRYPKGKEYITSIEYEPWHFRYVGKGAAGAIMNAGICLEEYVGSY